MIDEMKLEALKSEHGDDLHVLEAAGQAVVAKVPSRAEYQRFTAMSSDKKKAESALYNLAAACIVYPARDEWAAIAEKRPGLPTSFASELLKLAGLVDEVEAKKA